MDAVNIMKITELIKSLSDLYGLREPSDIAIGMWLDTLEPINPVHTLRAFNGWAARHNKMPTPADIFKIASDFQSERMEALAEQDRKEFEAGARRIDQRQGCSPACKRALERWFARFNNLPPVPDKHWVECAISQHATGFSLNADGKWEKRSIAPAQISALSRAGITFPISKERIEQAKRRVLQVERERRMPKLSDLINEELEAQHA